MDIQQITATQRLILGRIFLEGTWVGCVRTPNGPTITIEFIDQASGQTIVRGRQFDPQGNSLASWTSESVLIDTGRLTLSYAYLCDVFSKSSSHQGLASFAMIVQAPDHSPSKLDGYSIDITNGSRDKNTEFKLADTPMDDTNAIAEAKRLFGIP
ncbi:MAG: hypothetical protein HC938_17070 [Nitrospira sp.]|nr:hypothetical protein [Nitrospira sp.]